MAMGDHSSKFQIRVEFAVSEFGQASRIDQESLEYERYFHIILGDQIGIRKHHRPLEWVAQILQIENQFGIVSSVSNINRGFGNQIAIAVNDLHELLVGEG